MYVYSTLTSDNEYPLYREGANNLLQIERSVVIKGGAGLANKHFVTPRGVVTKIDDDEYKLLKDNEVFKLHVANGFITTDEKLHDIDGVVADMLGRDASSPLVPQDFAEGAAPIVNSGTTEENPAPSTPHVSVTRDAQNARRNNNRR